MVQASQVTASVSVTVLASVLVYNIHELELMQRMYEGRHLTVRDPLQLEIVFSGVGILFRVLLGSNGLRKPSRFLPIKIPDSEGKKT